MTPSPIAVQRACIALLSFICFGVPLPVLAEVYRWEQPDGTVVYSDEPGPNSKQVEVKELPTVNLPAPPISTYQESKTRAPDQYKSLTITSPANETTIRNNTGSLSVTASLSPDLKPVHQLQLSIDGNVVSPAGKSTSFNVNGVDRGTHSVTVEVVSKDGKVFQSSPPITIHVFRFSKLH